MKKFKSTKPTEWLELQRTFEQKKKGVKWNENERHILRIPIDLLDTFAEMNEISVKESMKKYTKATVELAGRDKLALPHSEMVRMFEEAIGNIKTHVNKLLQVVNMHNIKYIFMVGGFSSCDILQWKLKHAFPDIPIIVPNEAELVVVKGAVMYGNNPTAISSRRSKLTYGKQLASPDEQHIKKAPSKSYIVEETKKEYIDIFEPFVKVNELVEVGQKIERPYVPVRETQAAMSIKVYTSEDPCEGIIYADDPRLSFLGDINVQMTGTGLNRSVKVTMQFGDSELKVSALQVSGCEEGEESREVFATFDFLAMETH